jgi:hypothetical protein
MSRDPASWLLVERGWRVVDRDGEKVGRVEETIGDSGKDIFNGLSISTGLLSAPRYVPAEHVAEITDGRVRLDLTKSELARLEAHDEPPPSAAIRPD